jgi:molybdopterin converting factor small subunit
MAVTIHIPPSLRALTAGRAEVEVPAAPTVAEVLAGLWARHPGVRDRVLDEQGAVRAHVNVFVGADSIRHVGGLAAAVADGAELFLIPAVSGGC